MTTACAVLPSQTQCDDTWPVDGDDGIGCDVRREMCGTCVTLGVSLTQLADAWHAARFHRVIDSYSTYLKKKNSKNKI